MRSLQKSRTQIQLHPDPPKIHIFKIECLT